ncbi:MAG: DUF1643 domain-containing protein [Candidatus Melainabacteria bacterium]|nr:DUF1643 domain-containing protein [Candidatus Melainabacteria bacterium]
MDVSALEIRENSGNGAVFDASGCFRYQLWRGLKAGRGRVLFVMLNPNTADEQLDDPTIKRCIGFARDWGFGRLDVVNLFALRTRHPSVLIRRRAPVGPLNDTFIVDCARAADLVIAAWGNHGSHRGRDAEVLSLLRALQVPVYCLQTNNSGQPRHPLYVRSTASPGPFL